MQDEGKTKGQLIIELHELRERVTELEKDKAERKLAEETLRESEERFRQMIVNTGDVIWQTDEEARFVYISPQIEKILGYQPEELIGKTPFPFLGPALRIS